MIALLVGTRPELIKMAPVMRALDKEKIDYIFIHSNQHYSPEMDLQIMNDLRLKKPDYNLNVGSGSHAVQTGKIMEALEKILIISKPKLLLVHGDTNTTLSGALTAKKLNIPVAHIEAGLRSFDYKMPEEINRIIVDRISDLLFAPTKIAKNNLKKEGMDSFKIIKTGNTVVDALYQHISLTKNNTILKDNNLIDNQYILTTVHRAENTDEIENLRKVIEAIEFVKDHLNLPVIWPIHPRTKQKCLEFNIDVFNKFKCISPVGYIDMLNLMNNSRIILTDSGGLQEEAYILKKPLLTLRDSTERPETLSANFIVDHNIEKIKIALQKYEKNQVEWKNEFGKGNASKKIVKTIKDYIYEK